MNVLFGLIVLAIDLCAGLPMMWTLLEGPPITAFGIAIALLHRRLTGHLGDPLSGLARTSGSE